MLTIAAFAARAQDEDDDAEEDASPIVGTVAAPKTEADSGALYIKKAISDARFGVGNRETLLRQAYGIAGAINKSIFGQEVASAVMQDRVIQYLENFPNRNGEPPHVNFIGLTGVGKSAIVEKLRALGFPVLVIDAQKYAAPSLRSLFADYEAFFKEQNEAKKPLIVIVEELDKLAEIRLDREGNVVGEVTSPTIGAMNEALSGGKVASYEPIDMSNFLLVTNMNFSPFEVETFSREVLGAQKSFYDFTVEDFDAFDRWIQTDKSARYKVLSRLFRSNTVGRLAPNTVIMQSLKWSHYEAIARKVARDAIELNTTGPNKAKRLQIQVDDSLIEFLVRETTYAPSGARETVKRTSALVEQLISFGEKATSPGDESLNRPRRIRLSAEKAEDGSDRARISVTPRIATAARVLRDGESFEVTAPFNAAARLFLPPADLAAAKPAVRARPNGREEAEPRLTQKQIRAARFPKAVDGISGLADDIASKLIDQEELGARVEDDFRRYLGRTGVAQKDPPFRVLAGLPGNGKSDVVALAAAFAKLPVVKINMQNYSKNDDVTVAALINSIAGGMANARKQRPDGKFILLIEELDKVHEIDPDGKLVPRPVMAAIKDLMNDGRANITIQNNYGAVLNAVDIRGALTYVTMNFSVDLFGFVADPRLTTAEDVRKASESLKKRPADLKKVLGRMFLPETVSRMLPKTTIVDPPTANGHKKIVSLQVPVVARERLQNESGMNTTLVTVELEPSYRDYLLSESMIPSEGARYTVVNSKLLLGSDLEAALQSLPRDPRYATKPLILRFRFQPRRSKVIVRAVLADDPSDKGIDILERPVTLRFPPMRIVGQVPLNRMRVSAHEFGHARLAQVLGQRFETVVVAPPSNSMGGYVKFRRSSRSARDMMADVYLTLASRAFERMVLSDNPMSSDSLLSITPGASMDIKMATESLFSMLNQLGFNPNGGTMDRVGFPYANFAALPHDVVEKLGLVMRDMENFVLEDMLKARPREWYVSKISELARAGAMSEDEFYKLTEQPFPGEGADSFGAESYLREVFGRAVTGERAQLAKAREAAVDANGRSIEQTVKVYSGEFLKALDRWFVPAKPPLAALPPPKKGGAKSCAAF